MTENRRKIFTMANSDVAINMVTRPVVQQRKLKRRADTVMINGVECTVYDTQEPPTSSNVFDIPLTPWILTYPVAFAPHTSRINTPHRWLMHMVDHMVNLSNGVYEDEDEDDDESDGMSVALTESDGDYESCYDDDSYDDDDDTRVVTDNEDEASVVDDDT